MKESMFKICVILIAVVFTLVFCIVVIPPFIQNPDIVSAFASGFVNPYSSGYSLDVICCWLILLFWIIYEYSKVKYGWICLIIGIVPGVAVGFTLYLYLRTSQLREFSKSEKS